MNGVPLMGSTLYVYGLPVCSDCAKGIIQSGIEKVVMVEIDPCVIEACKEHLNVTACELENPKLELRIEDGLKYVKETRYVHMKILIKHCCRFQCIFVLKFCLC